MRGHTAAAPLRTEICHLRHIRACFGFRGERPHSIICRKGENGQPQNKNSRRIQRKKPNRRLLNLYIRVCQKILCENISLLAVVRHICRVSRALDYRDAAVGNFSVHIRRIGEPHDIMLACDNVGSAQLSRRAFRQ